MLQRGSAQLILKKLFITLQVFIAFVIQSIIQKLIIQMLISYLQCRNLFPTKMVATIDHDAELYVAPSKTDVKVDLGVAE